MNSEYYKENSKKIDAALELMAKGASYKDACRSQGLSLTKFTRERNSDPDFGALVDSAEVNFKLGCIEKISESTSWQAHAWMLERKFKEEYGKVDLKLIRIEELPKIADNIMNILIEELSEVDPEIVKRIGNRIAGIKELDPGEYEVFDVGKEMTKVTKSQVRKAEIAMRKEQMASTNDPNVKLKLSQEIADIGGK